MQEEDPLDLGGSSRAGGLGNTGLESLAKSGVRSRSEITNAAMGERAECVMLNKGPYVVEAVRTLDDILHRMEAHHERKRSMLRKLCVATGFSAAKASADAHHNHA